MTIKEKNLKLIMELIFIFILPLAFLLPNIKINNEYVYDDSGNFASSDKIITYDSIVYNSYYKNYLDYNQLFNSVEFITYAGDITLTYYNNVLYLNGSNSEIISASIYVNNLYANHIYFCYSSNEVSTFQFNYKDENNQEQGLRFNKYCFVHNYFTSVDLSLYFVGTDLSYNNVNTQLMIIDLTQMFGSGYEPSTIEELSTYIDLSVYHVPVVSEEIVYESQIPIAENNNIVNSTFVDIKNLISNVLLIDSTGTTFNIIIDYTTIWFIMFIIWHFLYLLFDFIIHLAGKFVPKKE